METSILIWNVGVQNSNLIAVPAINLQYIIILKNYLKNRVTWREKERQSERASIRLFQMPAARPGGKLEAGANQSSSTRSSQQALQEGVTPVG